MLNDALFAMITLLKMNARDSFEDFFALKKLTTLPTALSISIFFVATKTKTKLALVIAFGIPVMEYSR